MNAAAVVGDVDGGAPANEAARAELDTAHE
jgi:hypothetical protein